LEKRTLKHWPAMIKTIQNDGNQCNWIFFSLAWVYEVIEIFWLYFSGCVWIVVNQSESSI